MSDRRVWILEIIAAQLALVVAAIHLQWGLRTLVIYLNAGTMPDPRPPLFVLSATAIVAGIVLVALDGPRRPVYGLGILLMFTYMFGYAAWHLGGHGSILPWVEGYGHVDVQSAVHVVGVHLADDAVALVSKVSELLLAAILGTLLYLDET